jgi:flagellar protein FliO/FliZ
MDGAIALQTIIALVFVLAMIGLLAMLARRLGFGLPTIRTTGEKRMEIVEVLPLDARRRLVLVRCDQNEHLLLLGLESQTIIGSSKSPVPIPLASTDKAA